MLKKNESFAPVYVISGKLSNSMLLKSYDYIFTSGKSLKRIEMKQSVYESKN